MSDGFLDVDGEEVENGQLSQADTSRLFPVDFESLDRDQVVSQQEIEKIVGLRFLKDPDRYNFKLMQLVEQIRLARADLAPNVRMHHHGIRIMSDSEALVYRSRQLNKHINDIGKTGRHIGTISPSGLSEGEVRSRDRRALMAAAMDHHLRRQRNKVERELNLLGPGEPEPEE